MKFIVFEGLDGSGKTTLINALQHKLNDKQIKYRIYQGLGSSSIGPSIRHLFLNFHQVHFLTRFYLSIANMTQTQTELINPALAKNALVILDRWVGSTYAYQLYPFLTKGNKHHFLKTIFDITQKELLIKPDLTIYLDLDPQLSRERKKKQKGHQNDLIERQPVAYFQKVRAGYGDYLTRYPGGLKLILDGKDKVQSNLQKIIKILGAI
ncbi:MAG: dTMP kinase [Pigeon pea little leaf phytoplasma]|uniref:Thymidylate kinase n=1 Tax=Candidatus Phytoplasma fabacearum TaxID=2982628 RepID=A0ABU8ZTS1_9MOLU|nr:dTMP kinase [Sweet potato little leaf phytoplasma]MDV3158150.1 dTMP kinase [Pigeon pea little leaf phytoplasma]MDV3202754.1 dTMP kinase [Candidatus Phytoplasma stylosanthis]MDV3146618.1 dTMP kinase [Sweet potato little leaf phytoplasma]MDV3146785.1 dTMP kinase [Sweet potato little leaf phytoplasma]